MAFADVCDNLLAAPPEQAEPLITLLLGNVEAAVYLTSRSAELSRSDPARAFTASYAATRILDSTEDHVARSAALLAYGRALRVKGSTAEAIAAFEQSSAEATQAGDEAQAARSLLGKIDCLAVAGDLDGAEALAKDLSTKLRTLGLPLDAAKATYNLGNVFQRKGDFRTALKFYDSSAADFEAAGDPFGIGVLNFNRGLVLSELVEPQRALDLIREARSVFEQANHQMYVSSADLNLGYISSILGQYSSALSLLKQARDKFAEVGQAKEVAAADLDIGEVYRALNLRSEALDAYTAAIDAYASMHGMKAELARALLGRAAIQASQGDLVAAGSDIDAAEKEFAADGNNTQLAVAGLLRAYWLYTSGDIAGARSLAESSDVALTKLRLYSRVADARYLAARIALEQGEDATRKMISVRVAARKYALGWLECRANHSLGKYYAAVGNTESSLRHLRASVASLESARSLVPGEELHTAFISNKLDVYEDIVAVLVSSGRPKDINEAIEFVERSKSRLLLERVQAALSGELSSGNNNEGQSQQVTDLRNQLNELYNQIRPDDNTGHARFLGPSLLAKKYALKDVEKAYNEALNAADAERSNGLLSLIRVADAEDLCSCIDHKEALLEYYIIHGSVCAFIVTSDSKIHVIRDLTTAEHIDSLARKLRFQMMRAATETPFADKHRDQYLRGVQKVLTQLYQLLLEPLEGYLERDVITVVPHGPLHGLPFHAFFDGVQYAVDRWEMSYAPSATIRFLRSNSEAFAQSVTDGSSGDRRPLLIGVPNEGLEHIESEVRELERLIPDSRVYCGKDATVAAFRQYSGSAPLIHLATHALFRSDNPLFSGLKFTDGWLLARDLYTMRLNCDLVTLSACRTGQAQVESGDEMFGLLRGFLVAGARSVAVSLWPAEDEPTAKLMTSFHDELADGSSKSAALRAAQIGVREMWQHPYHWAAFALFGEK